MEGHGDHLQAQRKTTRREKETKLISSRESAVNQTIEDAILAAPHEPLAYGDVVLRLDRIVPGDPSRNYVPYYHFRILRLDGTDVGHINFRVGDTEHIRRFAGHIGFQIAELHRGHRYAGQACRAIAPLLRTIYKSVLITCDPSNAASRHTIEKLGAAFLDEIATTVDSSGQHIQHIKRRYIWTPEPGTATTAE
jgi:tagatose 1,6-diphosphate aldolase